MPYYCIMKQLLANKNWGALGLLVLGLIPIITAAYEVITSNSNSINFLENYGQEVVFLVVIYYIFLLGLGIYWFIGKIIFINRLRSEKANVELMFLRSQVSPHFFFNMLNNLYGLVKLDADKAQKLILKLSDTMRYSIYEGEKEMVSLEEELEFLKNYIELHIMRYHAKVEVDFIHDIKENVKVAPLLYIILLENAFKHGVETLTENAKIYIYLNASEREVQFTIENNFDPSVEETRSQEGIGLKNLTRRLELIYPKRHELLFSVSEDVYRVKLTIK